MYYSLLNFKLSFNILSIVLHSSFTGISSPLCSFFGLVLIPKYFDKRKGLANGCVVSISASGMC